MFLIDQLMVSGGAEQSLYMLAKGLKSRGHRVIISCLKAGELSRKMQSDGLQVEESNLTRIYDTKGIRALFGKISMVRRERVSVIMAYHESSDFFGILAGLLARVPVVSSRRDMGFALSTRHIWSYRLINRFFDQIVTVSSAVKEVVVKTQWCKRSDIVVIHNGVDSFSSASEALGSLENFKGIGFSGRSPRIVCVANIRAIKGHRYLVDAAIEVVKRFPDVCIFFAGRYDLNDPTCIELERQIRDLGLENTIELAGEVPRADLSAMYAAMDISVLPSLSEGMSNTVLESMSAGKCVVATAVGGNPEIVEDGKTGYLVPPGDPHSMAEALLKLLANPELRRKMGLRAKSLAESKFSAVKMVDEYENMLQRVCMKYYGG